MLKVLHIFGQMMRAGAELRTVELMPHLAGYGVHVDFCTLTPEPGDLDERIRQYGGDVHACAIRNSMWSFGRRFRYLLDQGRYDIVHSHVHYASGYMLRLAHRAGIRGRIAHFRTTSDGRETVLMRKAYSAIMRRLINKHATNIVSVSRAAMECAWGSNWSDDSRTRVIYNGLDVTQFDLVESTTKSITHDLNLPIDARLAICVARFEPNKMHSVLLDAFAIAHASDPRLHLLLAGEGPLQGPVEAQARALGVRQHVHFLGVRDDVPRLLKECDVLVLASQREGLPGVVLEALAARLPVVATDLPCVREIMEHTSLIRNVPVGDADELARSIGESVAENSTLSTSEGEFPKVFDIHQCAHAIHSLYVSAAGAAS